MEETRFDNLTRALRRVRSRRSALTVAAAALGGLALGRASQGLAAPGGQGKGNGGSHGNSGAAPGHNKVGGSHGNSGNAPGRNKVGVCHRTHDPQHPFVFLLLPPKAAQAHQQHHGDAIGVDLQTDVENCGACGVGCATLIGHCQVATCVGGACGETAAPDGTACDSGSGPDSGTCQSGSCIPLT